MFIHWDKRLTMNSSRRARFFGTRKCACGCRSLEELRSHELQVRKTRKMPKSRKFSARTKSFKQKMSRSYSLVSERNLQPPNPCNLNRQTIFRAWTDGRHLGAGESGKSTILKQMRLIHTDGFPVHERKEVRQVIFSNMVVAFRIIAEEMRDLGMNYENEETYVILPDCTQPETANYAIEIRGDYPDCRRHRDQRLIPTGVPSCHEGSLARSLSATHHQAWQ